MYFSECPPASELIIPNVRCCPTAPELLRTIFRDVRSHPAELKRCPSDPGRISPNVRLRNTPLDVSWAQQHPMHTAASLWDKRVLWQDTSQDLTTLSRGRNLFNKQHCGTRTPVHKSARLSLFRWSERMTNSMPNCRVPARSPGFVSW